MKGSLVNVRPFCIALFGLALAAATPAAALDARDLMGGWYASGLTGTTAEQDPTILELFLTVNLDGTIDIYNEATGKNDQSYAFSYGQCFQPRAATSNSTEADEDDIADEQTILQTLVTGGTLQVSSAGVVTGTIELDAGAQQSLGYDTIVIDGFQMNSTAELITGVTNLSADRVMHMNMIRLPVDEDVVTIPCLFDDCNVTPAPTATLTSVNVAVGDTVAQGDALATVTGDLTETLTAPADGLVVQVDFTAGATVEFGQTLAVVESAATTVSTVDNGQQQSQFAEGSWAIAGYFETIEDGGQEFSEIVPATSPSWEILSLNVEIGSAVTENETVATLRPTTGGGTDLDVLAPSDGVVTEVYRKVTEIVFPDVGGEDNLKVSGAGTFPGADYKILCLGPTFFDFDLCASANPDPQGPARQLQVGDYVTQGTVVATIQLSCCPGSTRVPVYASGSGVITQIDVESCFGTFGGSGPPPSCTEEIVLGSPLMTTTATVGTVTGLNVTTNQWVNEGDVVATVQSEAGNSPNVEVLAPANGSISEIFLEQWSQNVEWDTPFMTVANASLLNEEVDAGETLFVVNKDPTCHPDFSTNYSIRATSISPCETATITSVGVTPGESLCAGDSNLVAYEYSCPNPDDPSGPPITGSKGDFKLSDDSVVESVNVAVSDTVNEGDVLITFRRGYDTLAGSISGSVRVYAGNDSEPGGLSVPHTGQLQTSTVEFTDSCELEVANNAVSSSLRVSRSIKGQPSGTFSYSPDPGGDWFFQISKDRNFAIGNSIGFYLGGNFRHQNMLMVKGPQEAIHVPSLGLGDPAVTLTSLHGLYETSRTGGPYPDPPYSDPGCQGPPFPLACAGATVSVGDPLATLTYTPSSGDPVEQIVVSPIDGYVDQILYAEGTTGIAYDQTLMTLRSSPTYPTPENQPTETTWQIRGFADATWLIPMFLPASRSGTLDVNADGDQLTGGNLESSSFWVAHGTVTGGAVELVIPSPSLLDPPDTWQPEKATGQVLFGVTGDEITFAGNGVREKEDLMLSFQRDVIAGVTEDTDGVTSFVVGMVPEPSARLLALAALGSLGVLRMRLRGRR